MGAKRKYRNPASTTVKSEKWKLDLLTDLKIDHTRAFNVGVDQILQVSMDKGLVQSANLERILSDKKEDLAELQVTIKLLEDTLSGNLIPEAMEKKRQAAIDQVCGASFGANPRKYSVKLPENDHHCVYGLFWTTLAGTASENSGFNITCGDLCKGLRSMISRELNYNPCTES